MLAQSALRMSFRLELLLLLAMLTFETSELPVVDCSSLNAPSSADSKVIRRAKLLCDFSQMVLTSALAKSDVNGELTVR